MCEAKPSQGEYYNLLAFRVVVVVVMVVSKMVVVNEKRSDVWIRSRQHQIDADTRIRTVSGIPASMSMKSQFSSQSRVNIPC